ncbi:tetratricopeptide repeat-containing sulfotransferase family protein [Caulobacter segnis]|uniref:Sulfotransferase family protein n=1 Tax=Caulobacter segnis TaxID=88688 RepID=A0A2W5WPG9_9CAUL|nr:tetratricopeptide repeat-containing sulfotransferase family protein [Caulobacter segnis]PZR35948.1 MAG: sulfotransferase family protein [Caulobacter segnis]
MISPRDLEAREATLRQARALREQRRVAEALAMLDYLYTEYPRFSRLHQERGHCLVAQGDGAGAIVALREAVRLNPALPASWDMLEQLHRLAGDLAEAGVAAQRLAALKQLPPPIVMAQSLLADGDLEPAEAVLTDHLRETGETVGALRLLARIRLERGALADAEALLAAILDEAPDYREARFDYAMVLLQGQKHLLARRQAERLLVDAPDSRDLLKLYGAACLGLGDFEPVIDLYARLLAGPCESADEIADLRLWRANALKAMGRGAEAIADYRAALSVRPDHGVAWFSLANLKTHRFTDDDVVRMRAAEARPGLADMDRVYLRFALGKACEDQGDHATSWAFYARGNALRRASSRYRQDVAERCAERLKQTLTADVFTQRQGWGLDDPAPIFVVGLPRSGSTLIEQILASHSQVEGTHELTEIGRYAGELCGCDPDCGLPVRPEALLDLTAGEARALGDRFLQETRAYRRLGRAFFIDKMPNNFWHIGLIHLILPRATILDVRREPMACGFSNFKQLFGTTHQEFTYSLEDIGGYYRIYRDLMRHWDTVLPGRVLRVRYEDVVEDLEAATRRMLAHGGLAFEPSCLNFHQTRRGIRTPSAEQVRQPIGREGLEQWKRYEPWLAPLRAALGDAMTETA